MQPSILWFFATLPAQMGTIAGKFQPQCPPGPVFLCHFAKFCLLLAILLRGVDVFGRFAAVIRVIWQ
ncbi:hypothetical protein CSC3H3_04400 [Thalassospira marina]|uniref:Secreted protein n=1 Tax=Thalassospira marina TaxID=2048283 RepID=A0ABN5FBB6_9PROT|nr:hypothetical protein CSC3H3_04400 [Thalassospira marina]